MGILDSFKNLARPYDENDMFLDDDEIQEDAFPEPEQQAGAPAPSAAPKAAPAAPSPAQSFSSAGSAPSAFAAQSRSSSPFSSAASSPQVAIYKPEKVADVSDIADHIMQNHVVIMNLEKASKEVSRRLIDILSGVAFARSCKIQFVAANTYTIVPDNVSLTGDVVDELENNGLYL